MHYVGSRVQGNRTMPGFEGFKSTVMSKSTLHGTFGSVGKPNPISHIFVAGIKILLDKDEKGSVLVMKSPLEIDVHIRRKYDIIVVHLAKQKY